MEIRLPNDAPFALCLTHDVDRITKQLYHYAYYGLNSYKTELKSLSGKIKGYEPYQNIWKIMELEDKLNVRSTFLFLHETHREFNANFMGRYLLTDEYIGKSIGMLEADGWEIGIHGSYFSYNNLDLYCSEYKLLQSMTEKEIVSVRQHHLNLDENTFQIQKSLGLKYDSTVGYSNKIGEDLPALPYFDKSGILEIPITLMDKVLNTTKPEDLFRIFYTKAEQGGVLTLDFHQCYLNEIENPYYVTIYKNLIDWAKTLGAWIAPMCEIGAYFESRIQR